MQEKQKKAIRWISPVLIALTALIVWRVNYEIEFMMDDEWYSTVLYADTPIRNLSDIIRAQIWHYFNWGGRSMAHALLQLILLAGEHWADILNTGMTLLLGWLCLHYGRQTISAITSYLIRVLPLTLIRKPIKNRFIRSFLYYVPYVTLAVMTFPAIIDATATPTCRSIWFDPCWHLYGMEGTRTFPGCDRLLHHCLPWRTDFLIEEMPASFFDPGISSIPKVKIKIMRHSKNNKNHTRHSNT